MFNSEVSILGINDVKKGIKFRSVSEFRFPEAASDT